MVRLAGAERRRAPAALTMRGRSFELRVAIPVDIRAAEAFYGFIAEQMDRPYDWGAIVRLALGVAAEPVIGRWRDWRDPSAWYCFDLIMAAFEAAGMEHLPIELPFVAVTGNELVAAASAGEVRFTPYRFGVPLKRHLPA